MVNSIININVNDAQVEGVSDICADLDHFVNHFQSVSLNIPNVDNFNF